MREDEIPKLVSDFLLQDFPDYLRGKVMIEIGLCIVLGLFSNELSKLNTSSNTKIWAARKQPGISQESVRNQPEYSRDSARIHSGFGYMQPRTSQD